MLTRIAIQGFALIEGLDLVLPPTASVAFLGEAGSGKSLLLAAIQWTFGVGRWGRHPERWMRPEAPLTSVELTFTLAPSHPVWETLREFLLDDDTPVEPPSEPAELVIARLTRRRGERILNQYRVQGMVANARLLEVVSAQLMTAIGQHDQVWLTEDATQMSLLDRVGGDAVRQTRLHYEALAQTRKQLQDTLADLVARAQRAERERTFLTLQLDELVAANLEDPEEENRLFDTLRRAEETALQAASLDALQESFYGDSGSGAGLIAQSQLAQRQVADLMREHPASTLWPSVKELVDGLVAQVEETVRLLRHAETAPQISDEVLEAHQARLSVLKSLKRKYGITLHQVIEYRNNLQRQLEGFDSLEVDLEATQAALLDGWSALNQAYEALSSARSSVADDLSLQVSQALKELAMPHGVFQAGLTSKFDPQGDPLTALCPLKPHVPSFLFSASGSAHLAPLGQVASGGELARLMLVLATYQPPRTAAQIAVIPYRLYLLDEVDTGASGVTAQAIARYVQRLTENGQVFLVSHQPLVASLAETFFWVSRQVLSPQSVQSDISPLQDTDAIVSALVQMASGEQAAGDEDADVKSIRQYAKTLLAKARKARDVTPV